MEEMEEYLKGTGVIDCDSPAIRDTALAVTQGLSNDREKAVALFYYVRDRVKHNPYAPGHEIGDYRASATLERGSGHCEHKAVLLIALCRAVGIPSRLGLVDVRDHLLSPKFRNMIGGDNLLIQHGYAQLWIDGRWLHVSPAYDLVTCQRAGFVPVEFDGTADAKDSPVNAERRPHIEHVKDHGHFHDLPWDFIVEYRKQWVASMGRGWEEFTDNVKQHQVD